MGLGFIGFLSFGSLFVCISAKSVLGAKDVQLLVKGASVDIGEFPLRSFVSSSAEWLYCLLLVLKSLLFS